MRYVPLVLTTLLAMPSALAAQSTAQNSEPHNRSSIRGTVINAVTREPISRAVAYSPDGRFAAWTDEEGHFSYPLPTPPHTDEGVPSTIGRIPNPGSNVFCCLEAKKPGYVANPDRVSRQFISIETEPVLELLPEAIIKGRVSLPTSDAAFGIVVQIFSRQIQNGEYRWTEGRSARANSSGEFRFAELIPGEYKVVTHELLDSDPSTRLPGSQLYGYPPIYYPSAVDFGAATAIQLKAGQTFEADISPSRQPYYPVRIPVAGDLANGQVRIAVHGRDSPGYSLGYNNQTHRIEGLLPNGAYDVTMEVPGNGTAPGASGSVALSVSGAPVEASAMTLARNSSIRFQVSENFASTNQIGTADFSNGKEQFEVHGPRVYLRPELELIGQPGSGRGSIRPPSGPDDESLVMEDVPAGLYRLRLFASRGYVASATADGVDLFEEPLVVVTGNSTTVDVNMRDDFAELDCTVDDDAAPARKSTENAPWNPPGYIYLLPQTMTSSYLQMFPVDPDGHFAIAQVPPGNYLVLAYSKPRGNLPYLDPDFWKTNEAKGRVVRLAAGQKEKVELHLVPESE